MQKVYDLARKLRNALSLEAEEGSDSQDLAIQASSALVYARYYAVPVGRELFEEYGVFRYTLFTRSFFTVAGRRYIAAAQDAEFIRCIDLESAQRVLALLKESTC